MRKISMSMVALLMSGATLLQAAPAATVEPAAPGIQETKSQRAARMAWWREARFGMFIHWGLFSVAGGHEIHRDDGQTP